MRRNTMRKLLSDDLKMRSYRIRKVHLLSQAPKAKRLTRCRLFLKRLRAGTMHDARAVLRKPGYKTTIRALAPALARYQPPGLQSMEHFRGQDMQEELSQFGRIKTRSCPRMGRNPNANVPCCCRRSSTRPGHQGQRIIHRIKCYCVQHILKFVWKHNVRHSTLCRKFNDFHFLLIF